MSLTSVSSLKDLSDISDKGSWERITEELGELNSTTKLCMVIRSASYQQVIHDWLSYHR